MALREARSDLSHLSPQLIASFEVKNRAWGIEYNLGLWTLKVFLLDNLGLDLKSLDLGIVLPNLIVMAKLDSLKANVMLDAFFAQPLPPPPMGGMSV